MIRQLDFSPMKTISGKVILTVFVLAASFQTHAHQKPSEDSTAGKFFINYLGTQDEMFKFHVHYNNTNKEKFMLQINENKGNVLFKEYYTEKTFNKTFLIPKDLEGQLNFVFRNAKDKTAQTFEVVTNIRVSEDDVITKIK